MGSVGRGVSALSAAKIAEVNDATMEKMRKLHPFATPLTVSNAIRQAAAEAKPPIIDAKTARKMSSRCRKS